MERYGNCSKYKTNTNAEIRQGWLWDLGVHLVTRVGINFSFPTSVCMFCKELWMGFLFLKSSIILKLAEFTRQNLKEYLWALIIAGDLRALLGT